MNNKNLKILAIDDNFDNLFTLRVVLSDTFPESVILTATNGTEGIHLALQQDPDVILLDIIMPGMDGYEVCRRLKKNEQTLQIPVIFLTALKADRQTRIRALEAGGEAFLNKPLEQEELVAQIRAMVKIKAITQIQRHEKERLAILVQERTYELEQELLERRKIEQELRHAHQDLLQNQTAMLSLLGELNLEVEARKLSEAALRESEEKHRILLEEAADPIFSFNPDGRYRFVNKAFAAIVGMSTEEIVGKQIWDVLPQAEAEKRFSAVNHVVKTGEEKIIEVCVPRPEGNRYYITTLSPVKDDVGKVITIICSSKEITERKKSEERLRLQSTALEAAANAIVITDREGFIHWINPAFTRLTGYSHLDVIGANPRILKSGIQDQSFYKDLWDTILSGQIWKNEFINKRKDGSIYIEEETITPLLGPDGQITHFIGVKQDITERKQHERELETVTTVSAALRSASNKAEMFPVILDQLLLLLNVEGATIEILNPLSGELIIELGRGMWASATGERIPAGKGLSALVLASREPYFSKDITHESRMYRPDLFGGINSVAGTILMVQQQIIGLLWIGRHQELTTQELRLLTAISDIAANAIYRAALHEQTEYRLQQLSALRKIDQTIINNFDLKLILKTFVEEVANQLNVDAVAVLLYNPDTLTLDHASSFGFRYPEIEFTHLLLGEGQAGRAAIEKRTFHFPYLVENVPGLTRTKMVQREGFVSHHVTPIIVKQQLKGVLEIFGRVRLYPTLEWAEFFEAFANQAGIAIDNVQLFEGLQRSNQDLAFAYESTIEGWSRAMDLRDQDTENHTKRVTEMTLKIAELMEVGKKDIVHIRRGSLLHDIGKLAVRDDILLKPGQLTAEEWLIMRTHPQLAYDLLYPIEYLRPALDIPFCHHEKWDGTGYPQGLKGEGIPFAARIFAISDVYDALTSDRPYRKAWSHSVALEHIRTKVGSHFDPQVAEVFLEAFGVDKASGLLHV